MGTSGGWCNRKCRVERIGAPNSFYLILFLIVVELIFWFLFLLEVESFFEEIRGVARLSKAAQLLMEVGATSLWILWGGSYFHHLLQAFLSGACVQKIFCRAQKAWICLFVRGKIFFVDKRAIRGIKVKNPPRFQLYFARKRGGFLALTSLIIVAPLKKNIIIAFWKQAF